MGFKRNPPKARRENRFKSELPHLFKQQLLAEEQKQEQLTQELNQLKEGIIQVQLEAGQPMIKQKILQTMKDKYIPVCERKALHESKLFPDNWSVKKRVKFLHFTLAFVRLGSSRQQMDWKEIGASYYQTIGGSKVFDRNQREFLDLLEDWSGYPAVEFGLMSLGHITPVFFSGQVAGEYSTYQYGPVHSVTNLSIEADQYQTKATTLWIVENRGILTRIAAQARFLEAERVLMICCDGHIRSAHRDFIQQIITNSALEQAIIWTDYDADGRIIAHDLYNILVNRIQTIKWIGPEGNLFTDPNGYDREMARFLEKNTMEQEEMTGDVTDWIKWIKP